MPVCVFMSKQRRGDSFYTYRAFIPHLSFMVSHYRHGELQKHLVISFLTLGMFW